MFSTIGPVVVSEPWTNIVPIKARRQSVEAVPSPMEKWEKGLWETISCQSQKITITFEGVLFPSLVSERWLNVSLTAGVTGTGALGPDELLSLFAQLILMSAVAIQIRAYGPLSSQDGGQPQLVALACMRLCMAQAGIQPGEGAGLQILYSCICILCQRRLQISRNTSIFGSLFILMC